MKSFDSARKICVAAVCLFCGFAVHAGVRFVGAISEPVRVAVDASTGLEEVYVLYDTENVVMEYEASSAASNVKWSRFSNLGGAYAEDLAPLRNGKVLSVPCSDDDSGYIIEENGRSTCYWVVNYYRHMLHLNSLEPARTQACDRAVFDFKGSAAEIPYFTINGRRMVLSRELKVEYNTLVFDDAEFCYVPGQAVETRNAIDGLLTVPAPLYNSAVVVSGDRFLEQWGIGQSIESPVFTATAVDAHTRATQTSTPAENEQKPGDNSGLGGSAPCDICFEAVVSDAAIFTEWQFSHTADFADIYLSFSETTIDYTFTEQGTVYVRFVADNADGTCPFESETYTVFIGESALDIPNAFSPQSSPGVNDEWKVSYKSLVKFECHVFNSWGKELFSTTDPSQGWNGKSGGKFVPAGVYYYVIRATGADGVEYKRAGDINIINFKSSGVAGGSPSDKTTQD